MAIGNDRCGLEAPGLMNHTVIGCGSRVSNNRDLVLLCAVGNREGTVGLGDGVVLSLRVAVQRVGEGVGGAAHNRLGARKGVRGALARCPAGLSLKRGVFVDKRGTVVLLGKVGGLEGDRALSNSKRAIGHIKTNASAGIVARDTVHKRKARASKSHGVGANIGASRLGSHIVAQDNLILSN